MSWFGALKSSENDSREARRRKLETERQLRAENREQAQKRLQAIAEARQLTEEAVNELLEIDPNILGDNVSVTESEAEQLLSDSIEQELNMTDFDAENGVDGASALTDLKAVQCPFLKDDIEFWFSQLETQLEVIEIKSQWMKRIAVQRFLPADIQSEVKSLLSLAKTAAGNNIYFRIKQELIELFGQKPEDSYNRAKNRVMSGKPSQLGKALVEDICKKDKKLDGCCCDAIVWGLFREKLPIVIRNHIAQKPFNKSTYKDIFKEADKVFDSNRGSDPLQAPPVAAMSAASVSPPVTTGSSTEIAAVQKGQSQSQKPKNKKNKNANQNGNQGGNQNGNRQNQTQNSTPRASKPINDDGHCRIHAKWKENATFCAAPWGCKMKNVYRAPQ